MKKLTDKHLMDWLQKNRLDWWNEAPDYFVLGEGDGSGEPKKFMSLRNLARAGIEWDRKYKLRSQEVKG